MEVTFFTHDDYPTLRYKFHSGWANLDVELHHESGKLDEEGCDEFDSDAVFNDRNVLNRIAFTLTETTSPHEAMRLFGKHFGGRAFVLRDGVWVEEYESLDYCNNPFRLPLDEFSYGEFKRRFTNRWANLSIELYDTAPHPGGLWTNSRELADDFEMENLKTVGSPLHDYIFICDWEKSLTKGTLAAAIKNDKLGVYCEGNLRNARLKQFNEAENLETLRRFSTY